MGIEAVHLGIMRSLKYHLFGACRLLLQPGQRGELHIFEALAQVLQSASNF